LRKKEKGNRYIII